MRILAFETATGACSVAVTDAGLVRSELTVQIPRAHSTRLMPLIAQAVSESGLEKTDLDAIAAGTGPGSFTGLRIGLATAKGLAYALDKPCVGVCTLLTIAYGTCAQMGLVVPMLDAKRGYVYTAVYAAGGRDPAAWTTLLEPAHLHVTELAKRLHHLRLNGPFGAGHAALLCGDAAEAYADAVGAAEENWVAPAGALLPRAWAVAEIARSVLAKGGEFAPELLAPTYLRKSEAETLWEARKSPSV